MRDSKAHERLDELAAAVAALPDVSRVEKIERAVAELPEAVTEAVTKHFEPLFADVRSALESVQEALNDVAELQTTVVELHEHDDMLGERLDTVASNLTVVERHADHIINTLAMLGKLGKSA